MTGTNGDWEKLSHLHSICLKIN